MLTWPPRKASGRHQTSIPVSVPFHTRVSSLCLTMESHFPLPPSVLLYLEMMELLRFLRMRPWILHTWQIPLYLRRLSDEQEPQHGLQSGGRGESPFARLRTPFAQEENGVTQRIFCVSIALTDSRKREITLCFIHIAELFNFKVRIVLACRANPKFLSIRVNSHLSK